MNCFVGKFLATTFQFGAVVLPAVIQGGKQKLVYGNDSEDS
jgi:hypothetical protein